MQAVKQHNVSNECRSEELSFEFSFGRAGHSHGIRSLDLMLRTCIIQSSGAIGDDAKEVQDLAQPMRTKEATLARPMNVDFKQQLLDLDLEIVVPVLASNGATSLRTLAGRATGMNSAKRFWRKTPCPCPSSRSRVAGC